MVWRSTMKTLSTIFAVTLLAISSSLMVACAPQPQEGITPTEENLATTQATNAESETYHDEGLPPDAVTDDFLVRPYIDTDMLFENGVLNIQYKANGNTHITDVEVNRGNCAVSTTRLPVTLGFGNTLKIPLIGCDFTQVLEVNIITSDATYTYLFDQQ